MASPSKQPSKKTSRTKSKKSLPQAVANKDEADNIEKNRQALDLMVDMLQSVRGDQITSEAKAGLIRIHGLLRGIQMRDLAHRKHHGHANEPAQVDHVDIEATNEGKEDQKAKQSPPSPPAVSQVAKEVSKEEPPKETPLASKVEDPLKEPIASKIKSEAH